MAVRRNYYYRNYYYMQKRKKQKFVVYMITGAVIFGIGFGVASQVFKPKTIAPSPTKQQEKADQNISNLYIQSQELKSTMQQQNSTVVLSGTKQVAYTFSNQKGELNSKGNPIGFLKKTLDNLTVKKLTYETEYSYLSTYDNKNIETKVEGDKLYITLFERALSIKGISEDKTKTVIKTDIGVIQKNFTPQETNAMGKYISFECYNSLINDNQIKKESIDNMRKNVIEMCRKLNIKSFQINVSVNNTLEYESNKLVVK